MNELQTICTEKLSKRISNGSGVDCLFINLDDKTGVKFVNGYKPEKNRLIRDLMYDRQLEAFNAGLAPNVGEMVDLPKLDMYGMVTDLADVIQFTRDKYLHILTSRRREEELVYAVDLKMYETLGWWYEDPHSGNYGFLPDGHLVRIDFGQACLKTDPIFRATYFYLD